ncbi:MAG: hypothetical protein HPY73_04600 [Methanomassiliicoccales archaeon]|nr:MAG: hypothetical protein HPY73_04600 [Methanomassiliicoccales archaeon]
MTKKTTAPYGPVCSECKALYDNITTREGQDRAGEGWDKYRGTGTGPEMDRYKGCNSPTLDGFVLPEIDRRIKHCADPKGLGSRATCPELPNDVIKVRSIDCGMLRERLSGRVKEEDRRMFLDPCGLRETLEGTNATKSRQSGKGEH